MPDEAKNPNRADYSLMGMALSMQNTCTTRSSPALFSQPASEGRNIALAIDSY